MKAVVAALNQEKALVGAFSVITNLRMELFEALMSILQVLGGDLPALHPLPQLGLHLDPHLRRLARLHHRLPRPAVRVEGRELVQQGGRWGVHGEEQSGDIIIYLIITHFR